MSVCFVENSAIQSRRRGPRFDESDFLEQQLHKPFVTRDGLIDEVLHHRLALGDRPAPAVFVDQEALVELFFEEACQILDALRRPLGLPDSPLLNCVCRGGLE